jgi:prepilin-type N-terminal cleavage/methylation domain-containing protein
MSADRRRSGFTLLELLVAMIILMVIVLATARIFDQSTVAWDSGSRKAEVNMTGRAVADFMAQEISQAVYDEEYNLTDFQPTFPVTFVILSGSPSPTVRAVRKVQYQYDSGAKELSRSTWNRNSGDNYASASWVSESSDIVLARDIAFQPVITAGPVPAGASLPLYVDVGIAVNRQDEGRDINYAPQVYVSRGYLVNRERYR